SIILPEADCHQCGTVRSLTFWGCSWNPARLYSRRGIQIVERGRCRIDCPVVTFGVRNVRFWPPVDMLYCAQNVRFLGIYHARTEGRQSWFVVLVKPSPLLFYFSRLAAFWAFYSRKETRRSRPAATPMYVKA